MVSPEWLDNRTQPIGVRDVIQYLAEAASIEATREREIHIGGPEVMTYPGFLWEWPALLGRRSDAHSDPRGIPRRLSGTPPAP